MRRHACSPCRCVVGGAVPREGRAWQRPCRASHVQPAGPRPPPATWAQPPAASHACCPCLSRLLPSRLPPCRPTPCRSWCGTATARSRRRSAPRCAPWARRCGGLLARRCSCATLRSHGTAPPMHARGAAQPKLVAALPNPNSIPLNSPYPSSPPTYHRRLTCPSCMLACRRARATACAPSSATTAATTRHLCACRSWRADGSCEAAADGACLWATCCPPWGCPCCACGFAALQATKCTQQAAWECSSSLQVRRRLRLRHRRLDRRAAALRGRPHPALCPVLRGGVAPRGRPGSSSSSL